jgi:hypothetical protein
MMRATALTCLLLSAAAVSACQDKGDNQSVGKPSPNQLENQTATARAMIGNVKNCRDPELVLFDNMNGGAVMNGGAAPDFDTRTFDPHPGQPSGTSIAARRYCLIRIETYHWNGGKGAAPGTVGLDDDNGKPVPPGPWPATGSPGQGGAPNANWSAVAATPAPGAVLIQGHYKVADSSPATWSGNAKAGHAFARVIVKEYDEGP